VVRRGNARADHISLPRQAHDLERVALAMGGLASRLSAAHRLTGEAALDQMRQPRSYDHLSKAEAAVAAPHLVQSGRSPIDFRALDGVGTPLVAGQGQSVFVVQLCVCL
jgi:hypothetical protein